jgi:ABC-type branched-subunit amino acid transport system permease subunit
VFSLGQSVEVIIWVIAGGLGTLAGPMLGALVLGMLKLLLGEQTLIDNSLLLGVILILVVLLLPRGVFAALTTWRTRSERGGARSEAGAGSRRRRRTPNPEAP